MRHYREPADDERGPPLVDGEGNDESEMFDSLTNGTAPMRGRRQAEQQHFHRTALRDRADTC